MTTLVEEPTFAIVGGGLLVVVMIVFWIATRMSAFLLAAGVALLLTIGLVTLEKVVVTDFEAVEETLKQIALDAEQNDPDELLSKYGYDSPEYMTRLQGQIRGVMQRFTIEHLEVGNNLKIELYPDSSPPQAITTFTTYGRGRFKNGNTSLRGPVGTQVILVEVNDEWKVAQVDYREGSHSYNTAIGRTKKARVTVIRNQTPPR